uniref:Uncharacterized protein n=1 Tax=Strongyloides venezuelensis TaxID=75913 RepID=A0A0K0EWC1_STRVS
MKYNVLVIGIFFATLIMIAHGYLNIMPMPLKNGHDKERINGRKLLYDFLKQDSLLKKSQYMPFSQLHLKYSNMDPNGDNEDIKRNERGLSLNDLQRLNIPIITNPKQTKYTRSNCFLSPVQCSFFLP